MPTRAYEMGGEWTDSGSPAFVLPNGGTAPVLTAFTTNTAIQQFAINDLAHFHLQLPHSAIGGGECRIHCHFTFVSQPTVGRKCRWEVFYTVADVNAAFSAESAAQYGEYTVQASDSKIHRVQSICTITLPANGLSAAIVGRIRRVASTGTEVDVEPMLLFVDGHFQQGSFGTSDEFSGV